MTTDCDATGAGISTGSPGTRRRFSAATAWRGRCVSRPSLTGRRFPARRRRPAKTGAGCITVAAAAMVLRLLRCESNEGDGW